jgi:hypothetical protein
LVFFYKIICSVGLRGRLLPLCFGIGIGNGLVFFYKIICSVGLRGRLLTDQ